ncbi:2-hydroxy-3-keto-5-methylthiopentenyl-1-phosphate phosphatase [Paenibacillus sp. MMS18-CY102]|uniref:2-hydroxy-3-keto-5-methylthiopentenyl-1- phosphate phosphatase n=1 Tax=Paenibacillus sp. MMS18-CY102 TaxID=2682849 RepID=UPI001365348B|nr:2-hydroxy-3-keto-5-methylthiopentenyl-1-phosphate phosphatase [Paenibacillus sp. MMS18-CY102]MWC28519.1 2-hydroxy-3-keto-5-methylthiopentenyl-1-phosphate phosphatase [Paenibacillus sp. MMS18-CY102]
MSTASRQRVIFCDFDGTITVNDNIIAIIKHFNPPGWEAIVEEILSQRISIRQGVGDLFRLLPTSRKDEVIQYGINNVRIREGFAELLAACAKLDIDFYVTSGGIDFFVYPVLEQFGIPRGHIYCNGSNFEGEQIEITWPNPCDGHCTNDCGMCKTTIMRRFPADRYERILIGDSVTDFEGAKQADLVFSRSQLTVKCQELGLPHIEFESFLPIVGYLSDERMSER